VTAASPVSASALLVRCRFPEPGTAVDCAVSGGPDSVCLVALAVAHGCRPTAWHVDHGLRPDSAAEAEVVAAIARHLGADWRSVRVDVAPGANLEARARSARYGALPAGVLTGHTLDDQAETVLVNLMRGAAASGLAAMRPDGRRPLLALRRAETHAYAEAVAAAAGVTLVDDPSNRDVSHLRNRVRHELLPALSAAAARDLAPVLARQADLLRDESDLLDRLAAEIDPTDARALAVAPLALARRALRRWLSGEHPPDGAAVERVLAVARGDALAADVGGGREVRRSAQRLHLTSRPVPPT
jgi:tRNA(Ile)-lysidine synthase